jgi:hypothetical protein
MRKTMTIITFIMVSGCSSERIMMKDGTSRPATIDTWIARTEEMQAQVSKVPLPFFTYASTALGIIATGLHFFRRKSAGTSAHVGSSI